MRWDQAAKTKPRPAQREPTGAKQLDRKLYANALGRPRPTLQRPLKPSARGAKEETVARLAQSLEEIKNTELPSHTASCWTWGYVRPQRIRKINRAGELVIAAVLRPRGQPAP